MKFPRFLAPVLIAVLLSAPFATAADHDHDNEDHTPLGEQMEMMGKAFRTLRKQVGDSAQNAGTLELLGTIRSAAEKGLEFEPAYTAEQPEAERAAFVAAYRKDLHAFIDVVDQAIAAVKAGDNETAGKVVREMIDAQRSSHKSYRKPKED